MQMYLNPKYHNHYHQKTIFPIYTCLLSKSFVLFLMVHSRHQQINN
ncbi:hypothetical protein MGK_04135 [Candida albicans P57055]|nr:hypothetical protein MGK_04135 [Candida albicans P57055]